MKTLKRYYPLLLLLTLALTLVGDALYDSDKKGVVQTNDQALVEPGKHSHEEGSSGMMQGAPPDPVKQHRMGIYHYNEGNRFLRENNWREAVHNYEMALSHDPKLIEVYVNMSTAYLKGRQYDEAKKTLDTLASHAPDLPALHYNLACYHSLTGDTGRALADLKRAVELGFEQFSEILNDPDLAALRATPQFKRWFTGLSVKT